MLNQYPVIDGFSLRSDLRCDLTFFSLAVAQFEALRRAGNFRQRQWSFPRDPITSPIPAFDSSEVEIRFGTGAVIWGFQIVGTNASCSISGFQLREACTGEPLFNEPQFQFPGLWPGTGGGLEKVQGRGPILLPRLLVIGKPGLATIEVMTFNAEPATDQIIFYGGVPVGVTE